MRMVAITNARLFATNHPARDRLRHGQCQRHSPPTTDQQQQEEQGARTRQNVWMETHHEKLNGAYYAHARRFCKSVDVEAWIARLRARAVLRATPLGFDF